MEEQKEHPAAELQFDQQPKSATFFGLFQFLLSLGLQEINGKFGVACKNLSYPRPQFGINLAHIPFILSVVFQKICFSGSVLKITKRSAFDKFSNVYCQVEKDYLYIPVGQ